MYNIYIYTVYIYICICRYFSIILHAVHEINFVSFRFPRHNEIILHLRRHQGFQWWFPAERFNHHINSQNLRSSKKEGHQKHLNLPKVKKDPPNFKNEYEVPCIFSKMIRKMGGNSWSSKSLARNFPVISHTRPWRRLVSQLRCS